MKWQKWLTNLALLSFLVLPASTNFKLEGYSLGGAGSNQSSSTNYSMQGAAGELDNGLLKGTNYNLAAGLAFVRSSNVPTVATFDNPSNYYNKLHLVVGPQNNSSDTKFAIAISSDSFVTTYYVKSDNSVGGTLALTDTETVPPYAVDLGDLNPGSVVTGASRIWVDFDTNANSGGSVFVYGQNAGLKSTSAGYTIATINGDLTGSAGFGAQAASVAQTSGGPMTMDTFYNLSGNNVGLTDNSVRQIFLTNSPVVAGRASFLIKAKSDNSVPTASDYTEALTVVASANY